MITTITRTDELAKFCTRAAKAPYVTVDTEFLRERTYYAKLCLVQLAYPGNGKNDAVLVDPLSEDLSLEPLYALFENPDVVKVFHAARQDLEIFFVDKGIIPEPLFDTQVAAMVCGFGDQVGYETLVKSIARAPLDKSSRFTDWSRRPLSEAQQSYALADVTHLRKIYEHLNKQLEKTGRSKWLKEELKVLQTPETYVVDPAEAWQRIKTRTTSGKFLALVRELAAFRESYAQENNVPRTRVYKDDALVELASLKPQDPKELSRARLLLREGRRPPIAEGILAAIERGMACKPKDYPKSDKSRDKQQGSPALSELLRVLLKAKTEETGVAAKLIVSAAELDQIAAGARDVAALKGWRGEVFGHDALRLCEGEIALTAKDGKIVIAETG